jgi:membrane associated rhomboid family serine protease
MFLHANITHIAGNMWFLWIFGSVVEGRLNTFRFLILYFLAGACGDLLQLAVQSSAGGPEIPSIGASGAIMGVVGAAIYLFPRAPVAMLWTAGVFLRVFDIPMWGAGLYYLGLDVLYGVLAADNVGHFAHIGGGAGGFLLAFLLRGRRGEEYG